MNSLQAFPPRKKFGSLYVLKEPGRSLDKCLFLFLDILSKIYEHKKPRWNYQNTDAYATVQDTVAFRHHDAYELKALKPLKYHGTVVSRC